MPLSPSLCVYVEWQFLCADDKVVGVTVSKIDILVYSYSVFSICLCKNNSVYESQK